MSQSLFYWIIYSYKVIKYGEVNFMPVSILILLDYLFLSLKEVYLESGNEFACLNPYFIGLSILIDFLMSQ